MTLPRRAVAFAPGSVGNVAVGFDVLGHSVPAVGDRVTVTRVPDLHVTITTIGGNVHGLPMDARQNTAGVAVLALVDALKLDHGFELAIEKGIPLGSGLGGSAASAVAAVVAANALVATPADTLQLLRFAMKGEEAASGTVHVDNVAPSLYGGMVLIVGIDEPLVTRIPVPDGIRCVLVHPHIELTTREARQILKPTVSLSDVTWQQANLAGFLAGCFTGDLRLIRASLEDVLIEPQRKRLIPGFDAAKEAAIAAGALGCSISGAGPTIFAWCEAAHGDAIRDGIVQAFTAAGVRTDSWISCVTSEGAHVVEES